MCGCGGWTCGPKQPGTPIIIDTRGQGFHLTNVNNGVVFTFFPDSPPVHLSWTDPAYANGFLALPNADGVVANATQLFGNLTPQPQSATPNGYLALAV